MAAIGADNTVTDSRVIVEALADDGFHLEDTIARAGNFESGRFLTTDVDDFLQQIQNQNTKHKTSTDVGLLVLIYHRETGSARYCSHSAQGLLS